MNSQSEGPGIVAIQRSEYLSLLSSAREYQSLRTALIAGGVSPETLQLIATAAIPSDSADELEEADEHSPSRTLHSTDAPFSGAASPHPRSNLSCEEHAIGSESLQTARIVHEEADTGTNNAVQTSNGHNNEGYYDDDYSDRSLIMEGLSPNTTLADIIKVVRGGMLLKIFIRSRGPTAHIAFVDPTAAESFLMHSKRNDIYIRGKRIMVSWDDRGYYMPGYVARRVYKQGATRNIVVRFAKLDMTPDSIREDLEHIHQLEVVDITIENEHAFISTSGIMSAVTAKTCMASRLKYKGTRIEFYPDECSLPLPQLVRKSYNSRAASSSEITTISHVNRFSILDETVEMGLDDRRLGASRRNFSAN